jgi:hypothetical protein
MNWPLHPRATVTRLGISRDGSKARLFAARFISTAHLVLGKGVKAIHTTKTVRTFVRLRTYLDRFAPNLAHLTCKVLVVLHVNILIKVPTKQH